MFFLAALIGLFIRSDERDSTQSLHDAITAAHTRWAKADAVVSAFAVDANAADDRHAAAINVREQASVSYQQLVAKLIRA
jgi:hypothetical protein